MHDLLNPLAHHFGRIDPNRQRSRSNNIPVQAEKFPERKPDPFALPVVQRHLKRRAQRRAVRSAQVRFQVLQSPGIGIELKPKGHPGSQKRFCLLLPPDLVLFREQIGLPEITRHRERLIIQRMLLAKKGA